MIKEKYIERLEEISLNVVQGKIESIREKNIEKTGLRIFKDNKIGVAGAVGDYNEKELEERAIEALNLNIPYGSKVGGNIREHIVIKSNLPDGKDFIDTFERVLNKITSENNDFIFSGKINMVKQMTKLENSNNLDLYHERRDLELILALKEKNSVDILDLSIPFGGTKFDEQEFYDLCENIIGAYRNKVELPKKEKLPVVFFNVDIIILMKFIQELNGLRFGTGASIFSDNLNKEIFNKNFTLYDTRNQEESELPFFDGEGVINKEYRYALIENGVIKAAYTDKENARIFNLTHTGSAMGDYDNVQSISTMPNLFAKPGEKTAKELLNGEEGIFVFISSGGDFTPDGKYGSYVQLAYLFDGEKFIGRLPEIQINGSIYDIFGKDFRGVSSDRITKSMSVHYMITDMEVSEL